MSVSRIGHACHWPIRRRCAPAPVRDFMPGKTCTLLLRHSCMNGGRMSVLVSSGAHTHPLGRRIRNAGGVNVWAGALLGAGRSAATGWVAARAHDLRLVADSFAMGAAVFRFFRRDAGTSRIGAFLWRTGHGGPPWRIGANSKYKHALMANASETMALRSLQCTGGTSPRLLPIQSHAHRRLHRRRRERRKKISESTILIRIDVPKGKNTEILLPR